MPNVSDELKGVLRPLTVEERKALRDSISNDGVLEAVVVDEQDNIIDGMNRWEISQELGVDCPTVVKHFESDEHRRLWMWTKQLGRRNLSARQHQIEMGRLYNSTPKAKAGRKKKASENKLPTENGSKKAKNTGKTGSEIGAQTAPISRKELAEQAKVAPRTLQKSGKLAASYDKCVPAVQKLFDEGGLNNKQLHALADLKKPQQNARLRQIASGKMDPKELVNAAAKEVKPEVKVRDWEKEVAAVQTGNWRVMLKRMQKMFEEMGGVNSATYKDWEKANDLYTRVFKSMKSGMLGRRG